MDSADPGSVHNRAEFRCTRCAGAQLSARPHTLVVKHRSCKRQPNHTSHFNSVYYNGCIQDLMGCGLSGATHKLALVCLRMENTTAVAHVNNKGGTWSTCLKELTLKLWKWCLERNILVKAQHVPGKSNTVADSESRVFNDSSEWKIDPQTIFPKLTCLLFS